MRKQIRRVAGLGEGPILKKSVDLALRHPDADFVANDLCYVDKKPFREYLNRKGLTIKPPNLTLATGIGAAEFLAKEKPSSFGHIYAHFLLQHVPAAERKELFMQLWRTLRPGAKFFTVEEVHYAKLLSMEMANQGFKVTSRNATLGEVIKLNTPRTTHNARGWKDFMDTEARFQSKFGQKTLDRTTLKAFQMFSKDSEKRLSENAETPGGKLLVRRDMKKYFFSPQKSPYVFLIATKPRIRRV